VWVAGEAGAGDSLTSLVTPFSTNTAVILNVCARTLGVVIESKCMRFVFCAQRELDAMRGELPRSPAGLTPEHMIAWRGADTS